MNKALNKEYFERHHLKKRQKEKEFEVKLRFLPCIRHSSGC